MRYLNGLLGLIIVLVVLVSAVVILGFCAVKVQQSQARNHYTITDINEIPMKSSKNSSFYKLDK